MKFPALEDQVLNLREYLKRRENFSDSDLNIISSPYRISPLGSHIDHQGGPVLGMTINAGSLLAFIPNGERKIRLYSTNYPGIVEFSIDNIKTPAHNDWGRYAMGAAKVIQEHYPVELGFTGVISGSLPASGLSSSASAALSYLRALSYLNDCYASREELVDLDSKIENNYLKLQNGILDQSSIVYGKKNCMLYIDTLSKAVSQHLKPQVAEGFKILILFTGLSRELTSSGFNSRVESCKKTAALLGLMGGLKSASVLSDIPYDIYLTQQKRLPDDLKPWAAHYFSEVIRVEEGTQAWEAGNWDAFGKLMNESSRSTLENYENQSSQSKFLFELTSTYQGVYGAAVNGGGYGGCVVAFVREDFSQIAALEILANYTSKFPELREQAKVYFAESDEGLRMI